jgi:non-specific serine/threonine protein kinase
LDRHTAEHDNVRAALAWLEQSGRIEVALCLAYKIRFPWEERGYLGEIRGWLERLLTRDARVAPGVRAKALQEAGALALRQGDLVRARALSEPALALAGGIGARVAAAEALAQLAETAMLRGGYDVAEAQLAEAVVLCREGGDAGLAYGMLVKHGEAAQRRGNAERARVLIDEAVAALRERIDFAEAQNDDDTQGSDEGYVVAWPVHALVARDQGDLARAAALCEDAESRFRALGSLGKIAETLACAGSIALLVGDRGRATAAYRESLALFWQDGDRLGCAGALEGLAASVGDGQAEPATRLFGAAAAVRATLGTPQPPSERRWYDPAVAAARTALDRARFAVAWDAGRAWTLGQAVAEALEPEIDPAAGARAGPVAGSVETHGLTPREAEVLRLLAEGHTDREIAEALFVSRSTAANHVANILGKLGVPSRAAAAAWAVRRGLA